MKPLPTHLERVREADRKITGCAGKEKFDTGNSARRAARRKRRDRAELQAYQCTFCNGWHIGHKPKKRN